MSERRHVVETGQAGAFNRLVESCAEFKKLHDRGEQALSLFPYILRDIFVALYEDFPRLLAPGQVSTGARLNRLIMDQFMKNREFRRARSFARQSSIGAGMAAMYFGELVLTGLDGDIMETANEIFCTEEELKDALLQRKTADKVARVAAGRVKEEYAALRNRWDLVVEDKKKQLRSLAARLSMQWNTSGKKTIGVSGADEKGAREGRFATGGEGLGDNKGVWTRGDITPHLKLVENYLNSPKLKRLAERVGRLKEVREQQPRQELAEDAAEVRGIAYGNELGMVVPEEWADYFKPLRKKSFQKKYVDETLCLYDMSSRRRRGRGSLIICLDNSGSMQGPKEETSKAIAIALMEMAMAQKRDFVVIMFGGPDDDMKVFEIPRGQCTFEQLVAIGEYFLCSAGTDFEKPLQEAMRYLEKDKYPGGDIVFITDGVCSVSPEFLESYGQQKKTKQFRTIVVLVNYGQVSTAPVEAFCDELLVSRDLKGIDVAGPLFGGMRQ